jgi:hypothetical protein|tara:strand:- start:491 stop:823 length:333 start_codon:yes stop_codon:yes gene_type:complete
MIIKNSKIPKWASIVIDVYAITLWPFVFIRDHGDEVTINHEKIHLRQQVELLILGFYLLYGFFWLKSYIKHRDKARAYYEIPFEREAYSMQNDMQYLSKSRRFWAWLTFL